MAPLGAVEVVQYGPATDLGRRRGILYTDLVVGEERDD